MLDLVGRHPEQARLCLAEPVIEALPELAATLDGSCLDRPTAKEDLDPIALTVIAAIAKDTAALQALSQDPVVAALAAAALEGGPAGVLELVGRASRRGATSPQARRALRFLAETPGATGGQVQRTLGHRHGSQTSRLLHRLADQGLLGSSPGDDQHPGWRLTKEGQTELVHDDT